MVGNDIDRCTGTFKIVSPMLKSFTDGTQLFVVNIVVVFGGPKSLEVKGDWVQLA